MENSLIIINIKKHKIIMKLFILNTLLFFIVGCSGSQEKDLMEMNIIELTNYKEDLIKKREDNPKDPKLLEDHLILEYLFNEDDVQIEKVFDSISLSLLYNKKIELYVSELYYSQNPINHPKNINKLSNKKDNINLNTKLSLTDCTQIMRKYCMDSNKKIIKSFESDFNGLPVYFFLTSSLGSNSDESEYCISKMTPYNFKITETDCGKLKLKVNDWNSIPDSPKISL